MRIIVDRKELARGADLLKQIAAKGVPAEWELMHYILLSSSRPPGGGIGRGSLTLQAASMQSTLTVRVSAVGVRRPCQALLPADRFAAVVAGDKSDPTITIEARKTLHGYRADDFRPIVPECPDGAESSIVLGADLLAEMVRSTAYAFACENRRYAIKGAGLIFHPGGELEAVATDGYQLVQWWSGEAPPSQNPQRERMVLVPEEGIRALARLIEGSDDPIRMTLKPAEYGYFGTVWFVPDGPEPKWTLACRMRNWCQMTFPTFRDLIHRDYRYEAKVPSAPLLAAVERAMKMMSKESWGVRLRFGAKPDPVLSLSTCTPEMGEFTIEVEGASWEGDPYPFAVIIDQFFLRDTVKALDCPCITMRMMKDPGLPILFAGGPRSRAVVIQMPIEEP